MDPQQRKLLEVVYETFESAGASLEQLSGSLTACYVGCFTGDFGKLQDRDPEYVTPYGATVCYLAQMWHIPSDPFQGRDMTILSNRVNYVFNLKGPRYYLIPTLKYGH